MPSKRALKSVIGRKQIGASRMLSLKSLNSSLCDLKDLAKAACSIGVNLIEITDGIPWVLLPSQTGQFLLLQGGHCIGVDCTRRLVFDAARPRVLELSDGAIRVCGFVPEQPAYIREVQV